jgi:ribosomal protein L13E
MYSKRHKRYGVGSGRGKKHSNRRKIRGGSNTEPTTESKDEIISKLKSGHLYQSDRSGLLEIGMKTFNLRELKDFGFTVKDFRSLYRPISEIIILSENKSDEDNIFTLKELKEGGFSAGACKSVGYTLAQLKNVGFSAKELRSPPHGKSYEYDGFSAKQLKEAEFSAYELKDDAGFSVYELKEAGFSAYKLKDAGFSVSDLHNAGFSVSDLHKAGFKADHLKTYGYFVSESREDGYNEFSVHNLHKSGYTLDELKKAGTTLKEFKEAGITLEELISLRKLSTNAPYNLRYDNDTGYNLSELMNAGYDLIDDTYNLVHIFKSKKYAYGEIRDMYAHYTQNVKLVEIKKQIDDLKKKNCTRTMGFFNIRGQVTDLNCVYSEKELEQ